MDETELVAALIATAIKEHFNSIHTQQSQLEQDRLLIIITEIEKKMADLYHIQKVRKIKLNNDNDDDGVVMLAYVDKNFKGTCHAWERKGIRKKTALKR